MRALVAAVVPLLAILVAGDSSEEEVRIPCDGGYCVPRIICPSGSFIEPEEPLAGLVEPRFASECVDVSHVCCKNLAEKTNQSFDACGRSNKGGLAGTPHTEPAWSQFAEFPFAVAILVVEEDIGSVSKTFRCGGSLITSKAVLTVAHCVSIEQHQWLSVRLGEWDFNYRDKQYSVEEVNVTSVAVHPEYDPLYLYNDVALLIMQYEVEFKGHISPICLPEPTDTFDHQNCISVGWGESTTLKKVELPVVPHGECQDLLRKTRLSRYFELHESFTCAGGQEGVDMVGGDGGSPLFCPTENGHFVQAGIVAKGLGSFTKNVPGLYVDVAKVVPWIRETLPKYK